MKYAEKYRDDKELMTKFKDSCIVIVENGGSCKIKNTVWCRNCPFSADYNEYANCKYSDDNHHERLQAAKKFLQEVNRPIILGVDEAKAFSEITYLTYDLSMFKSHAEIAEIILKDLKAEYEVSPDGEPEDCEKVLVRNNPDGVWLERYYVGSLSPNITRRHYTCTTLNENSIHSDTITNWVYMKRIPTTKVIMIFNKGVYVFKMEDVRKNDE